LREFLQDMEGANLMRHVAKHGADRLRIERGAIDGDALEVHKSRGITTLFYRSNRAVMSSCVGS
jgi:hypothetical protein